MANPAGGNSMHPSDEQLMADYADGDPEAFVILYNRHKGRIMGYLFSRLKDRDEAEEVFQGVFAKLHAARGNYHEKIPFLPWVFTITKNALTDHLRKHRTRRRYLLILQETENTRPEQPTPGIAIGDAVAELASLNRTQRRTLELRFNRDFSFAEIAARLQTSTGNARQLVSRAVRRLRLIINHKGKR